MKCLHHDDLDGRGAASVVALYHNNFDRENYIEMNYGMTIPYNKIKEDELVYIVDFSFTENTVNQLYKLMEITKNIIWIDHHKSSMELIRTHRDLNLIDGLRYDGISGAALTDIYFHHYNFDAKLCPYYIQLINDYDCWYMKMEHSMHFKLAMDSLDTHPCSTSWVSVRRPAYLEELIEKGKTIEKYQEQMNKEYLAKHAFESEIDGLKCLCVNIRSNSLIFGDRINDYPIVCPFVYANGKYFYSLFTTSKDIRCDLIAKKFGGGGHAQAAGFSTEELIFRKDVTNNDC